MGIGFKQLNKDASGLYRWMYPEELPGPTTPPVAPKTMYGYNTLDGEGLSKMQRWGRVPIGRVYNGGNYLNPDGSFFQPGGLCYRGAGMGISGVVSSKRVNMSVTYDPASVVNSNSTLCNQMRTWVASIPSGWYVQVVMHHEYNLHTTEQEGAAGVGSLANFLRSHKLLGQAVMDADNGRGRAVPVINTSIDAGSLTDAEIVPAADMPIGSEWHNDAYDNPIGQPPNYAGYGTTYDGVRPARATWKQAQRLGYMEAGYGWGIDEFNAPRRVAPALAVLDRTTRDQGGRPIGWGPLSPHDIDGTGQAKSITDYCNELQNAPVPPTTVLLFTTNGTQWNQKFTSAGTATRDAVGPLAQGWPVAVDPAKPNAAYQAFIDISA